MVADEMYDVLLRFHREVTLLDMDRLEERINGRMDAFQRQTMSHFDHVYKRFDRLETEYHALAAAVRRLEHQITP